MFRQTKKQDQQHITACPDMHDARNLKYIPYLFVSFICLGYSIRLPKALKRINLLAVIIILREWKIQKPAHK